MTRGLFIDFAVGMFTLGAIFGGIAVVVVAVLHPRKYPALFENPPGENGGGE